MRGLIIYNRWKQPTFWVRVRVRVRGSVWVWVWVGVRVRVRVWFRVWVMMRSHAGLIIRY